MSYTNLIKIDNKLKFKEHFKKIFSKAKNGLNELIMTKNQLNTRAKLCIYHSLIHSHFSYCALAWLNNINKEQLNMLKTIQKKAVRIIHGKKYNSHTNQLFQKSNITKVWLGFHVFPTYYLPKSNWWLHFFVGLSALPISAVEFCDEWS